MQALRLPAWCLYLNGKTLSNCRMHGIHDTRRENLRQIIEEQFAGNQTRLAEQMGLERPSIISRLLTDNLAARKNIGTAMARKIENAAGKPEHWLDQPHHQARMPLADYNVERGPDFQRIVPVISWVQAGQWNEVGDTLHPSDADEWLPCPVRCSASTFVLRVRGASMEPRFRDGELVFVDPEVPARNKSYVIVRLDASKEATFKQLIIEGDHRYLRPLNPQ